MPGHGGSSPCFIREPPQKGFVSGTGRAPARGNTTAVSRGVGRLETVRVGDAWQAERAPGARPPQDRQMPLLAWWPDSMRRPGPWPRRRRLLTGTRADRIAPRRVPDLQPACRVGRSPRAPARPPAGSAEPVAGQLPRRAPSQVGQPGAVLTRAAQRLSAPHEPPCPLCRRACQNGGRCGVGLGPGRGPAAFHPGMAPPSSRSRSRSATRSERPMPLHAWRAASKCSCRDAASVAILAKVRCARPTEYGSAIHL